MGSCKTCMLHQLQGFVFYIPKISNYTPFKMTFYMSYVTRFLEQVFQNKFFITYKMYSGTDFLKQDFWNKIFRINFRTYTFQNKILQDFQNNKNIYNTSRQAFHNNSLSSSSSQRMLRRWRIDLKLECSSKVFFFSTGCRY